MKIPVLCLWSVLLLQGAGLLHALTPIDLAVDLTTRPGIVPIAGRTPSFSWKYASQEAGGSQSAYQIQVATATVKFRANAPDLWDSGKVLSSDSIGVEYRGAALPGSRDICWRVRVWDASGLPGPWSETLSFRTAGELLSYAALRYPQEQRHEMPIKLLTNSLGRVVVDFGRVSWGWAELLPPMSTNNGDFKFAFSVKLNPDGTLSEDEGAFYVQTMGAITTPGIYRIPFIEEAANTARGKNPSVRLPPEIGAIRPFRYLEIETCPYRMTKNRIRKIAISYPLNACDSAFTCDLPELDEVWNYCKNALAAATFAGVFVDGEKHRRAFEPDAWVQQLGHCAQYGDYTLQRFSQAYLRKRPGSSPYSVPFAVLMAWHDYLHTGDKRFFPFFYSDFNKFFTSLKPGKDGLYSVPAEASAPEEDCDGFVADAVPSPYNAVLCHAFELMALIADVREFASEAKLFREKASALRAAFQKVFFREQRGCFVDGASTEHASLCANAFALVFDMVPEAEIGRVAEFCLTRGMACGSFGAQFLLEALMKAGYEDEAISLMVREEERGWLAMHRRNGELLPGHWLPEKSGGDLGCAGGSAPANIIPRYLLGVRPLEPGFGKIEIAPQIGFLTAVEAFVPTARGQVGISIRHAPLQPYKLTVDLPPNTVATISVPACGAKLSLDGAELKSEPVEGRYVISDVASGKHTITVEK